ncbi:MAG: hypothetical protein AAGH87_02125 [Pseudomonadota bacterium]
MARSGARKRPTFDIPLGWILALGAAAFALSVYGWSQALVDMEAAERWQIAVFRAFEVNTLGGAFGEPFMGKGYGPWPVMALTAARWLGVLTFLLLLLKAYQGLFSEGFAHSAVAGVFGLGGYRDHIVIIGDGPLARAAVDLATEEGLRVVWCSKTEETGQGRGLVILSQPADTGSIAAVTRAGKARSVVIAVEDDAGALDVARHIRADLGAAKTGRDKEERPHLFTFVDDAWNGFPDDAISALSRAIVTTGPKSKAGATVDGAGELITESRAAARAVLCKAPLFLLAADRPQHAVIIGFDALGQSLLTEICQTQKTDDLTLQKITVIDADPARWDAFTRRVPEWDQVFDGAFFALDFASGAHDHDVAAALLKRLSTAPATAAYITHGRAEAGLTRALNFRDLVLSGQAGVADPPRPAPLAQSLAGAALPRGFPLFVNMRQQRVLDTAGETASAEASPGAPTLPIIPFGAWPDLARSARLFETSPDRYAAIIHGIYCDLATETPPPWSALGEDGRAPNRALAANLPALMHAAGFDMAPWFEAARPYPVALNALPRLAAPIDFEADAARLVALTRLEHARWCGERRLSGYRYGPKRDKERLHHEKLLAFDDLAPKAQASNLDFMAAIFRALAGPDPGAKAARASPQAAPRPGALQPLIRPTDLAILDTTRPLRRKPA